MSAVVVLAVVSALAMSFVLLIPGGIVEEGQTVLQAKINTLSAFSGIWLRGPFEVVALMIVTIALVSAWFQKRKEPQAPLKRIAWGAIVGLSLGALFGFSLYAISWITSGDIMGASFLAIGLILGGALSGFGIEAIAAIWERVR